MINVISNYIVCQELKDLKGFKMDLGKSYINPNRAMEIQDPFIIKQTELKGYMIYKYGSVGPIGIYYSHMYPRNEMEIWGNDKNELFNLKEKSPKTILAQWIKNLEEEYEPTIDER